MNRAKQIRYVSPFLRLHAPFIAAAFFLLCAFALYGAPALAQTKPKLPKIALEKIFKLEDSPGALAWSPDGRLLATADSINRRIIIWDYATQAKVHTIYRNILGKGPLIFTPDGKHLLASTVTATQTNNLVSLSLIDVASGKVVRDIPGPDKNPGHVMVNVARTFAMSPQAGIIAAITEDNVVNYLNLYKMDDWSLMGSYKITGDGIPKFRASDIAFIPDTAHLAILASMGALEIWDTSAGQKLNRFIAFSNNGWTLSFSPDGKFLATSFAGGAELPSRDRDPVRLWNTEDWSLIASATSSPNNDYQCWSLSFSSAQPYLASLHWDGKVRLWDARTLAPLAEVNDGGIGGVALAFSPDGRRLAILRRLEVRVVLIEDDK